MCAQAGRRVLLIDCDPQAKLSEAFGWGEDRPEERLEDLLAHPDAARRYRPPAALASEVAPDLAWRDRLRILPCTDLLADVAAELPRSAGDDDAWRLRDVLAPLRDAFDVVLLDTPPGRGSLSGMAVLAADGLLIPPLAADLDVRGAGAGRGRDAAAANPRRAHRGQRTALADHPRGHDSTDHGRHERPPDHRPTGGRGGLCATPPRARSRSRSAATCTSGVMTACLTTRRWSRTSSGRATTRARAKSLAVRGNDATGSPKLSPTPSHLLRARLQRTASWTAAVASLRAGAL
jgi:hypothetical protein